MNKTTLMEVGYSRSKALVKATAVAALLLANPVAAMASDGAAGKLNVQSVQQGSLKVSGVVNAGLDFPYIPSAGNYTAGQSFPLSLALPDGYVATAVAWTLDGASVSGDSITLTSGSHVIEAEVTGESGRKDIVTLEITVN